MTDRTRHSRSADKRATESPSLNLTSMLDVCFLLLIFFMLTAAFAVGEGVLPAEMPAGPTPVANLTDPQPPLRIALRSLGGEDVSIQLVGSSNPPTDFNDLSRSLRAMQHRPDQPTGAYLPTDPIDIVPDRTVHWTHVLNAYNAAVRAGYVNVRFAAAH
ncbi:MAG: hypothetical protein GC162_20810 [Planctomycetes bacterium]|nr:hypothetical protein [Planctomycetota bacterium]